MKAKKQLGIWMDHSNAILMELDDDIILHSTIDGGFSHDDRQFSLEKSESGMHTKEQHLQASYFKKISDSIRGFDEVLLIGPSGAKNELANILSIDHLFNNTKIEVKDVDRLTEYKLHSYVRDHFKLKPISK